MFNSCRFDGLFESFSHPKTASLVFRFVVATRSTEKFLIIVYLKRGEKAIIADGSALVLVSLLIMMVIKLTRL